MSGYGGGGKEAYVEIVSPPKASSDWECWLFGTGRYGLILVPTEGCEPNRFWRAMQYLCFGNQWVKKGGE